MKRLIALTVLASLLVGALSATGIREEEPPTFPPEEVTYSIVALRGPTGVGLVDAMQEEKIGEDIELEWELAGSPDIAVSRILSGEADLVTLPTNVAAQLYNRGGEVAVAGTTLWGVLYLVGPEGGPESWEQLKGRTVYSLARGATPDVLFRYFLQEQGLDPENDLTIDYSYGQVELAQLMASGEVELAVLPEPFVTQVTMRNPDMRVLLDFQETWKRVTGSDRSYPQTVFLARREVAQRSPEHFERLMERIRRSLQFALEDPAVTAELTADSEVGLPAAVTESALPRLNIQYESAQEARVQIEEYLQLLYDFNPRSVGGSLPGDEFYLDLE
ncbi:MAG: ABC transporter substrate-binding protein [Spirochaetaceae bacterium]